MSVAEAAPRLAEEEEEEEDEEDEEEEDEEEEDGAIDVPPHAFSCDARPVPEAHCFEQNRHGYTTGSITVPPMPPTSRNSQPPHDTCPASPRAHLPTLLTCTPSFLAASLFDSYIVQLSLEPCRRPSTLF